MALTRHTTRTFHRKLYAGWNQTVRLLKRGDNQKQGTVTSYLLFDVRRERTTKQSQTIQAEMSADHRTVWHIPLVELERVGIRFLNPLDRIEQIEGIEAGRFWQPESTVTIDTKLDGNHLCVSCLRVDPPR